MSKPKGRRKPLHSEITSLRRPAKTAQAVLTPADDSTEERVAANTGTADGSAADELADEIGAAPGDDENDSSPSNGAEGVVTDPPGDDPESPTGVDEALEASASDLEPAHVQRAEDHPDGPEQDEARGDDFETDEGAARPASNVISIDREEPDDMEAFLCGLIEALLFTSQRPLALKEIARTAGIDRPRARELLERLIRSYAPRGINIDEVAGGYVLRSSARFAPQIQKFLALRPARLSRAQLETLAIVAYRQPVTKPEVDDIRGVDSGQVLKGLLERSLLKILGKKDEPGRPMLYGTTNDFLELLNLRSLGELPTLREYTELSEESRLKFAEETGEDAPNELPLDDVSSAADASSSAESAPIAGREAAREGPERELAHQGPSALAEPEPAALEDDASAVAGSRAAAVDEEEETSKEDEDEEDEDEDEDEDEEDEDEESDEDVEESGEEDDDEEEDDDDDDDDDEEEEEEEKDAEEV
jgi:segregation and condensation protein B